MDRMETKVLGIGHDWPTTNINQPHLHSTSGTETEHDLVYAPVWVTCSWRKSESLMALQVPLPLQKATPFVFKQCNSWSTSHKAPWLPNSPTVLNEAGSQNTTGSACDHMYFVPKEYPTKWWSAKMCSTVWLLYHSATSRPWWVANMNTGDVRS